MGCPQFKKVITLVLTCTPLLIKATAKWIHVDVKKKLKVGAKISVKCFLMKSCVKKKEWSLKTDLVAQTADINSQNNLQNTECTIL